MPRRVCVLFDARTFDPFTVVNLERIRVECDGGADVHLVYSGAQPLPESIAEAPRVHVWDRIEGICGGPKTIPNPRKKVESKPMTLAMNSEVKTLNFATAAGGDYDLIIRIEFDVWPPPRRRIGRSCVSICEAGSRIRTGTGGIGPLNGQTD